MLHCHKQLYLRIYMQKHIQHNKNERTQLFSKIYLELYWKCCVWEGVGGRTKTATYWPPTLLAITAFLSHSPGLLNRGLGAQPLLGHGSHSSIFSLTVWTSSSRGYIIILRSPTSCERHICTQFNPSTVKVIPWYLRPDAHVIYTGAFLFLTAWPGSICNK